MATREATVVADRKSLIALRQQARGLTLLPRQAKKSLLAGQRASKLRGRGLDFEELRAYVAGDDVRTIDWRVTARNSRPFVRLYREERDRPVFLIVDQRPGMFFGSNRRMKSVAAAELAALIAWGVFSQGDRVGALVFGSERQWALRPARSVSQVHRLCESLVEASSLLAETPGASADAADALLAATRLATHDALVIVISDFRDLSERAEELVERLRRHNDALLVWVTDPLERDLPDVGHVRVSDGAFERALPAADQGFRREFRRAFEAERARFGELIEGPNVAGFELSSDDDVVERLREVLGLGGGRK